MTTSNSGGGELVQQFLGWIAEPDLEALTDTVVHWLMVLVPAATADALELEGEQPPF